ncbi:MAG TPA: WbqC family protein [Chitinophagaceae bacterium]|nr:WbqC family protein [Chitinophagaceae bacterium]
MNVAIMQPYFLPYLGYFQLIKAADIFVFYDNIQYTKKGWINRNRILLDNKDVLFSIPLEKSSDFLNVNEKYISCVFDKEREKILGQIQSAYKRSPYFKCVYPVVEDIFRDGNKNLFDFIFHSIIVMLELMQLKTKVIVSSALGINDNLKGAKKVLAICKCLHADTYINPIGGTELYSRDEFKQQGVNLYFHNMIVTPYPQPTKKFISHLSVIDVLMHNSTDQVNQMLQRYELL